MFLTLETLEKLKACEQGKKYIKRFYPNGAEIIDLINDRHINKEFLHWGREHLTLSEEEFAAYCRVCNIENSTGFWYSQNVYNSNSVIKSKEVKSSASVFESEEVSCSNDIVNSENITDSKQIFYSSMIDTSQKVYKGKNITESENICNSTMIARSKNVIDSYNVFDSSEIINSTTVTDSSFCKDCSDISFCMFCEGLEHAEYHIFNKPVSQKNFEMFVKQYEKYLKENLSFIREWPENLATNTFNIPTKKFDDWYYPISEKFWKWTRTLPGYDPMLLYKFTMLPDFLMEANIKEETE